MQDTTKPLLVIVPHTDGTYSVREVYFGAVMGKILTDHAEINDVVEDIRFTLEGH